MTDGSRRHAVSGAFVFLLLGVFAVASTLLALFGAQAYRVVVERAEAHNERRVLTSYVRNALRGEDARGALMLSDGQETDRLEIEMRLDGEDYVRYIYVDGGSLRELLISAGREFDPAEGEAICAAQSMRAARSGEMLTVEITGADGAVYAADIALKCAS